MTTTHVHWSDASGRCREPGCDWVEPEWVSVFDVRPTDAAALAQLWREEEVTDLDVDCPQIDYLRTAAVVLGRLSDASKASATLDPARLAKAWEKVVVDADRGGRWPMETWHRIAAEYAAAPPSKKVGS